MAEEEDVATDKLEPSAYARAINDVARTVSGRIVLREILGFTRTFDSGWDSDERQHAFNEGLRHAGLRLFRDLQVFAPDYALIVLQRAEDE